MTDWFTRTDHKSKHAQNVGLGRQMINQAERIAKQVFRYFFVVALRASPNLFDRTIHLFFWNTTESGKWKFISTSKSMDMARWLWFRGSEVWYLYAKLLRTKFSSILHITTKIISYLTIRSFPDIYWYVFFTYNYIQLETITASLVMRRTRIPATSWWR